MHRHAPLGATPKKWLSPNISGRWISLRSSNQHAPSGPPLALVSGSVFAGICRFPKCDDCCDWSNDRIYERAFNRVLAIRSLAL